MARKLSEFLKLNPPIVMPNIKMPGMDGIELIKNIKQENPDTEVILITGLPDNALFNPRLAMDLKCKM